MIAKWFYNWFLRFVGASDLYREVVVDDQFQNIQSNIRRDLTTLLTKVNAHNPHFRGRFTNFLADMRQVDDPSFFQAYAKLPAMSKHDYAEAGMQVMAEPWAQRDPKELELQLDGGPLHFIRRMRKGDFLMPMATGGSTALPLSVFMTKHHMFSMLFTFCKCWYRMGWRPGDRMLVFYPRNTYNIDDLVKLNRLSWLSGLRFVLFDKIDEQDVRGLVDELNRFKPKMMLVFPSPMNMIAHTIRRFDLPLQHHPPLINVSGETFFDCQRENIRSVFTRSKVEDSYGSVELGEIAHETPNGLEVFSTIAYVETVPNDAGQPEMVVTRLQLDDFPFIRYRMKDIATIDFEVDSQGRERFLLKNIEGKDSNFLLNHDGQRLYPSFFNRFVNELNAQLGFVIVEIKVCERDQTHLDVQLIIKDAQRAAEVCKAAQQKLTEKTGGGMHVDVRCVDFIDHDYRRKYRVIERIGDIEFAGGIVGDQRKHKTVREIETTSV